MSNIRQRHTTTPPPRPTTPLRPFSRTSLRSSTTGIPQTTPSASHPSDLTNTWTPLDSLEPQFAELSDSLSDLESNLMHLQLMHESLSRFSENFAAFLYGLEMNAFVVDWPEQPLIESYARWKSRQSQQQQTRGGGGDNTMMTTMMKTPTRSGNANIHAGHEVDSTLLSDTTFASLRATPRRRTMMPAEKDGGVGRGSAAVRGRGGVTQRQSSLPARSASSTGRGGTRGGVTGSAGTRGTGLPMRGRGRGVR